MKCTSCGTELPLKVLKSAAGFYIGRSCPSHGPYSRESGYYPDYQAAEVDLKEGFYGRQGYGALAE